jgi:hypothetical protein
VPDTGRKVLVGKHLQFWGQVLDLDLPALAGESVGDAPNSLRTGKTRSQRGRQPLLPHLAPLPIACGTTRCRSTLAAQPHLFGAHFPILLLSYPLPRHNEHAANRGLGHNDAALG